MANQDNRTRLEIYRDVVERLMGETLKGKSNPYTSMNGNMFSFLGKNGVIGLRLSDADRQAFLDRYGGGPVESYGAVMKGYVSVPDDLLQDQDALASVVAQSLACAGALPAKPTKKT